MLAGLAATLLPALAKSRFNSQAFQCLNNQRQMCAAWRMYADDSPTGSSIPATTGRTVPNPDQYAGHNRTWISTHNPANWDLNAGHRVAPALALYRQDAHL